MFQQANVRQNEEETVALRVSTPRRWIGLALCVILFSILIAFAMGRFRTFRVTSASMEPTVQIGDFLLVDSRTPIVPDRGDIVAVKNPDLPVEWLCKRVVGLPNDRIEIARDGYLYINGKNESSVNYYVNGRMKRGQTLNFHLDPGQYFVMGDNRDNSFDSIDFGLVQQNGMLGIVRRIYWPPSRFHSLSDK
ncbi:signal peptidase I [bacterium]|nr:signal peptidase I [bacterium]